MKINWFSPLPPAKTDIANYTQRILKELTKWMDVTLWTAQEKWSKEVIPHIKINSLKNSKNSWSDLNRADINVYNIGNNVHFHGDIWRISRICPGIVILHDFKLHHLFGGIYREEEQNKDAYLEQMVKFYGVQGREAGEKFWNCVLDTEYMANYYPLTELALENAIGVVTHTEEAYQIVSRFNRYLVYYVPLPYESKYPKVDKSIPVPPYRLIIFGFIGDNRRLDSIINALAQMPEKEQFRLDIYGEISQINHIQNQLIKLNLNHLVKIHGFVEESTLDLALSKADLAINLRYPSMGEASGSQLRIWDHSLPSLVTKVGWYSSLPEDIVIFIDPNQEIENIKDKLRQFLANPKMFMEKGKKGKELLETQHSPKNYVEAISQIVLEAKQYQTIYSSNYLIGKIGKTVGAWSKSHVESIDINRISDAVNYLVEPCSK
jgi:glycosyltransferase involved in cell wall biosynthesis